MQQSLAIAWFALRRRRAVAATAAVFAVLGGLLAAPTSVVIIAGATCATALQLIWLFRCPRCGNRFHLHGRIFGHPLWMLTGRCVHCGVRVGQAA